MIATSLLLSLCLRFLLFFSFEVGSLLFFQNGKVWSWAGGRLRVFFSVTIILSPSSLAFGEHSLVAPKGKVRSLPQKSNDVSGGHVCPCCCPYRVK